MINQNLTCFFHSFRFWFLVNAFDRTKTVKISIEQTKKGQKKNAEIEVIKINLNRWYHYENNSIYFEQLQELRRFCFFFFLDRLFSLFRRFLCTLQMKSKKIQMNDNCKQIHWYQIGAGLFFGSSFIVNWTEQTLYYRHTYFQRQKHIATISTNQTKNNKVHTFNSVLVSIILCTHQQIL